MSGNDEPRRDATLRGRALRLLGWAALGVALVLLFHPPMWAPALGLDAWGEETLWPGWDATRVFWPDLAFMRRCLLDGQLPLWNPYDRAGYAFAAEPQSGVYDPVTWLVVFISLPFDEAPAWLIGLKALAYYAIGAAGVAAFLQPAERRLAWLPNWAVAVGVLVYAVGGRMDKLKDQSGLWPSAWAPWLLVVLRWALLKPTWRRGVGLGAVGGLCVLSGYPPIAIRLAMLVLVPLGTWWLWIEVKSARGRGEQRTYLRGLVRCGATAIAVVVALVAAQVLATAQVLPMTMRADLPLSQVLASSLEPAHALGLLAPGASKVSVLLYAGVATGLGTFAALLVGGSQRVESGLLLALGAFGFLLACGANSPVLPALADLPGFRSFRIAGHFVVIAALATAVLAPRGLVALKNAPQRARWIAPPLALLGAAAYARFAHEPSMVGYAAVVGSLGLLGLLPFAARLPERARRLAPWALVAFIAADVYAGNRPVAEILQPLPNAERARVLANAVAGSDHRFADFGWAKNRPGPRMGARDLVGARPALTDRHYMSVYRDAQKHPGWLRVMGVEAAAFGRQGMSARRLRRDKAARGLASELRWVDDAWPQVFWTDEIDAHADEAAVLTSLRKGAPRAVAFGDVANRLGPSVDGNYMPLEFEVFENNALRVTTSESSGEGLVVFNEAFDPGWRARVDGEVAPIERVNLLHRAVAVPKGAHSIELEYRPPWVRALSLLWLFTLLGCAGLGVHAVRQVRS